NDDIGKLKTEFFKEYEDENMLDDGQGGRTWLPGFSVATMLQAWTDHKASAGYKAQVDALVQAKYSDLSGTTEQIRTLQNEIYGPGFSTIQEAQSDANKADPDFPNQWDNGERAAFQMSVGSDGWLPKYETQT